MERQEIAAQLHMLLSSVQGLGDATEATRAQHITLDQRTAARALLLFHEQFVGTVDSQRLHYKTRAKLLRVIEQITNLVRFCRLLEQDTLPDAFDVQRLRLEIFTMCRDVVRWLEPVASYYNRNFDGDFGHRSPPVIVGYDDASEIRFSISDDDVPDQGVKRLNMKDAVRAGPSPLKQNSQTKIGPTEVPVYFGTTRSASDDPAVDPTTRFLDGRGFGKLTLGRAVVAIPPGHRIAKLEQPLGIWKIRLKPNPEKHIVLRSVDPMDADDWVSAVRKELGMLEQRTAFVFVHGFNVTFSEAMLRAGQIARDIEYGGLVTAFSWGSEGSVGSYMTDGDTVQLSVPRLVQFLGKLRIGADVETFHIVAHSMGCRALLGALQETSWWNASETPVAEAVFAAPDVDATQYRESMNVVLRNARRYTLYASERDWAIALSRSLRDNHARAGDAGANILVMDGVETVDASDVGEYLFSLGHSYIADKQKILTDLLNVILGKPMLRSGLLERKHKMGKYWVFKA